MVAAPDDDDPFAIFTRAPANETPGERAAREEQEANAKLRSDAIDEELQKERLKMRQEERSLVRVLVLGQSESDFQMKYAREEWIAELAGWRVVIQLNLLKSVITILDTLQAEQDNDPNVDPLYTASDGEAEYLSRPLSNPGESSAMTTIKPAASSSSAAAETLSRWPSVSSQTPYRISGASTGPHLRRKLIQASSTSAAPSTPNILTERYQHLQLRLAPLRHIEKALRRRLGAGADEEITGPELGPLRNITNEVGAGVSPSSSAGLGRTLGWKTTEFSVNSQSDALSNCLQTHHSLGGLSTSSHWGHGHQERKSSSESDKAIVDEASELIASCRDDIKRLWADEALQVILRKQEIRLEDSPGFFLDDVDRIAQREYVPSDSDVLRARLRTLGIQEYRLKVDSLGHDWLLYDVGGSRTTRSAWIPYFENIHAIIFLAPLSCFDERLQEDRHANRLEDSFLLWRTVCASRLLANTSLILFMNKIDLLERKLNKGIKLKTYLPSYGDKPNDLVTVVKYLKEKFKYLNRMHSASANRLTYYYATSIIDTNMIAVVLGAGTQLVRDTILRSHIRNSDFI